MTEHLMNSQTFIDEFSGYPKHEVGSSTLWIIDDLNATAFVPIKTHSIHEPGALPCSSFFFFCDSLRLVSDTSQNLRQTLQEIGGRKISFGIEVNGDFIGVSQGQISNDIPQMTDYHHRNPSAPYYIEIQLDNAVPDDVYLEASGGKCWIADVENQRLDFFVTDDWIVDWFCRPHRYSQGCSISHMTRSVSFYVELDVNRCAIVVAGSGSRGYFGWSTDIAASSSRQPIQFTPEDLAEIGELDVPREAILDRKRGLEILQSVLKGNAREMLMLQRCTW